MRDEVEYTAVNTSADSDCVLLEESKNTACAAPVSATPPSYLINTCGHISNHYSPPSPLLIDDRDQPAALAPPDSPASINMAPLDTHVVTSEAGSQPDETVATSENVSNKNCTVRMKEPKIMNGGSVCSECQQVWLICPIELACRSGASD